MHVRGRAWHSSAAPRGVNAVEYAARLITAVSNRGRELAAVTGDADFSASTATLSVGPVRGGMSLNVVPDKCTFEVEARALPGQDPQALLSQAPGEAEPLAWEMRRVAPEAAIEIEPPSAYPPLAPPADRAPAELVARLAGGQRGLRSTSARRPGSTSSGWVPVVSAVRAAWPRGHRANEYIEVDQLSRAEGFLRRLADSLAAP